MELALVVAIFVLGAVAGSLITLAMLSDRLEPRSVDAHSFLDDLEARSRRVQ